jgi:hypothetical protein
MAAAAITNPTWAYDALPTQRRFHTDLRTRYKGYSGPIGSGKSKALCYEGIFLAQLNPGRTGLIGAPTYPMLRDATQAAMFEILADEGLGYSFNKSENRLTMARTGSQILFRSLDDFERLRGTNLAWFGIDELTYCKQESWSRLEGRLRDRAANRPCGFAVWTPKGFDWVYRKFIAGTNPEYRGYRGSPRENRHLPADFYDRLATSYDERFFKQEVLGEYLNVNSGAAYYAFDRTADVRKCKYRRDLPLRWSLDFNIDPMCSVICQIDETHDAKRIFVLDELHLRNSDTPSACEEFVNRTEQWTGRGPLQVFVYGDATGEARQRAGAGAPSDWAAVKQFFRSRPEYQMTFRYKPTNPQQRDRVAAVNAMLCNSAGERRTEVDPKCKYLIDDLEQVVWTTGTALLDQRTNRMLTHMSDAYGYLVETECGIRTKGGPRSTYVA